MCVHHAVAEGDAQQSMGHCKLESSRAHVIPTECGKFPGLSLNPAAHRTSRARDTHAFAAALHHSTDLQSK